MTERHIELSIPAVETSDGAGVRIKRSIGMRPDMRVDPFLMLDEFGSDNPDDYIAGFPSHPHRGFETVTYMLDGEMVHEDHLGNYGLLNSGGAQWMTAAKGIIHSEMPRLREGLMRGFQLWVNLPGSEKMRPAWYRDLQPEEIPSYAIADGVTAKVIAGSFAVDGKPYAGAVQGTSRDPIYVDFALAKGVTITVDVPTAHRGFLYPFEGQVMLAGDIVPQASAAVLSEGEAITFSAPSRDSRCLLILGAPIGEPVAQYGPFVMNTRAELDQAVRDFRGGTLTD
jgi:quercetin 2,3-dioxygenase